jgi:hypothetical protein
MKIRYFIKRLSNPRVKRRLKIGLTVWLCAIIIALTFKFGYDIGHFDAQSAEDEKNADQPNNRPTLNLQYAQRIVSGALKEDPSNPKTIVEQIIDNNYKLSTIVINNNENRQVAWIIEMRLFFTADLLNSEGYNLTESIEQQHNIKRTDR